MAPAHVASAIALPCFSVACNYLLIGDVPRRAMVGLDVVMDVPEFRADNRWAVGLVLDRFLWSCEQSFRAVCILPRIVLEWGHEYLHMHPLFS